MDVVVAFPFRWVCLWISSCASSPESSFLWLVIVSLATFVFSEAVVSRTVIRSVRLFDLSCEPPAVEKCSDKGCLPLSLLELLAFNMTFVFIASVLVLIEVRRFPCSLGSTEVQGVNLPCSFCFSSSSR